VQRYDFFWNWQNFWALFYKKTQNSVLFFAFRAILRNFAD
jgi:hypothetical protein